MTETEWLACLDYIELLKRLQPYHSNRKWCLASFACVRLLPVDLQGDELPEAIALAERIVEGSARAAEAEPFLAEIQRLEPSVRTGHHRLALHALNCAVRGHQVGLRAVCIIPAVNQVARTVNPWPVVHPRLVEAVAKAWIAPTGAKACEILREVFGNPFRPITFEPVWRTSDVVLLAQGIYEERAFDRMPILADALQDAGCDNTDLLSHLRDANAMHVRGCWALDLVLGKE